MKKLMFLLLLFSMLSLFGCTGQPPNDVVIENITINETYVTPLPVFNRTLINETYVVSAGTICFNGTTNSYCVNVPFDITVHQNDYWDGKCGNYTGVTGCALLGNKEIYLITPQGGDKFLTATLFHELMHFEYYYIRNQTECGHPDELIDRGNAFRNDLGIGGRHNYVVCD